jgi:hypothetical protein
MQQEKPKQADPGTPQTPQARLTPQANAVPTKDSAKEPPKDPAKETSTLIDFMCRLGQAYIASGEQTAQIELLLRRIASAHGIRKSRIVAFPTVLFVSVDDGTGERFTLAEGPTTSLRLDQIAGVFTLGAAVQTRELTPQQGLEQLTAILRKQPRFGTLGIIAGHTGWPLAGPASAHGEEILVADMNLADARRGRHLNEFNQLLRDRRTDVYDEMLGAAVRPGWY